jgi:hypothetical protein
MVQCETCKVWQHGLCMGYESEDQLHDDDYYCEKCRPEQHTDLLKYEKQYFPSSMQLTINVTGNCLTRDHANRLRLLFTIQLRLHRAYHAHILLQHS